MPGSHLSSPLQQCAVSPPLTSDCLAGPHDPSHGREVNPEMLADPRIAVTPRVVRRQNRPIALLVRALDARKRWGRSSPLRPRDVDVVGSTAQNPLHPLYEPIVAQKNLSLHVIPGAWCLRSLHEALATIIDLTLFCV